MPAASDSGYASRSPVVLAVRAGRALGQVALVAEQQGHLGPALAAHQPDEVVPRRPARQDGTVTAADLAAAPAERPAPPARDPRPRSRMRPCLADGNTRPGGRPEKGSRQPALVWSRPPSPVRQAHLRYLPGGRHR